MELSVSIPIFHAESFAIGLKSRIQVCFKLQSPESLNSDFSALKSIFSLYNFYFYEVMTHQNVYLDSNLHYFEFENLFF
jgi:hypothetical protein